MQLDVKKLETKQDIDYIENELSNNVDNAISDVNSDRKTNLGKVSRFIANRVKRLFGIDVSNRQHVLFDNDIRHMLNEHGNPYTEKQKGQIAITSVDIKNIPNIINNPDVITKGSDARNKLNSIRYIKRIDNNTITVAEIIPNKGSLQIKTMVVYAIKTK